MQLATGLHRLGSATDDTVNSYLVVEGGEVTVVDAAMPGDRKALLAELDSLGLGLQAVKALVLTHGDSDHIGFAERLRSEHDVPVYIHEADAARARGEVKAGNSWGPMKLGPTAGFMAYGMRKGMLRSKPLKEVVAVRDGQVLDLPGTPRIIGMPGHSPGSVAVHVPVAGAVFVGDALTTRHVLTGRQGPQPAPFTDDPAEALASLRRLEDLPVQWLLPGHGAPWSGGVTEAVRAIRAAAPQA